MKYMPLAFVLGLFLNVLHDISFGGSSIMVLRNTEVKDLTFLMAELRHMIMKLDYHSVYINAYAHI